MLHASLFQKLNSPVDKVCEFVKSRFKTGTAPIIVIAEGAIPQDGDMITKDQPLDAFGHVQLSGIGDWLAAEIETKTGYQTPLHSSRPYSAWWNTNCI
jgi:6-phosphofructokinase 1